MKSYASLLKSYILNSGLSLTQISHELKNRGFSTDKGYISKLQNGKIPPAGEDLNRAIAKITEADPDDLILAAYLEKAPEEVKNRIQTSNSINSINITKDQLHSFSFRLRSGLKENNISIEDVAKECNVTIEYLKKQLSDPYKLPGVSTLYKLAEIIGVTPDYLAGFTDEPQGHHPQTPRPRDMREFLTKEEVMFEGKILSEEDKDKINNVLAAIFMDAKKKNRRSWQQRHHI